MSSRVKCRMDAKGTIGPSADSEGVDDWESGSTDFFSSLSLRNPCPKRRNPPPKNLRGEAAVASGRFALFKKPHTKVTLALQETRLVAKDEEENVLWTQDLPNAKVSPMKKHRGLIVKSGHISRRIELKSGDYDTWVATFDQAKNYSLCNFYELGEQIGEGNFATVHYGTCLTSKEGVAIKRILKNSSNYSEARKQMLTREQSVLKKVAHPSIIQIIDVFEEEQALYVVMEYMQGGSLGDKLVELRKFPEDVTRSIVRQLLMAVEVLHKRKYVHRDVKPENLLIQSGLPGPVKLADFGLSCRLDKKGYSVDKAFVGSPSYIAPEMAKRQVYGAKIDVWACGVSMHAMLTGRLPFVHHDPKGLVAAIQKGAVVYHKADWKNISASAKAAVQALLTVNPANRPTASAALKLAFFAEDP